jgi:hypothetical protein
MREEARAEGEEGEEAAYETPCKEEGKEEGEEGSTWGP